jgi:hypothetical protein
MAVCTSAAAAAHRPRADGRPWTIETISVARVLAEAARLIAA